MRKTSLVGIAVLTATFLLSLAAVAAANGKYVKGVIANWVKVQGKVAPKAYFQLVKVQEQYASKTGREGLAVLQSSLPQVPVRSWGNFKINVGDLPPGDYIIALQRGLATCPIVEKDGKPLIIKIPGSYPLDVGKVRLDIR